MTCTPSHLLSVNLVPFVSLGPFNRGVVSGKGDPSPLHTLRPPLHHAREPVRVASSWNIPTLTLAHVGCFALPGFHVAIHIHAHPPPPTACEGHACLCSPYVGLSRIVDPAVVLRCQWENMAWFSPRRPYRHRQSTAQFPLVTPSGALSHSSAHFANRTNAARGCPACSNASMVVDCKICRLWITVDQEVSHVAFNTAELTIYHVPITCHLFFPISPVFLPR